LEAAWGVLGWVFSRFLGAFTPPLQQKKTSLFFFMYLLGVSALLRCEKIPVLFIAAGKKLVTRLRKNLFYLFLYYEV